MIILPSRTSSELRDRLLQGAVGVLRTDTIYGIVARADDQQAVERLYKVRGRDEHKPCIVLIANKSQIWDREEAERYADVLHAYWPGPVSIILPVSKRTPAYVHRGGQNVAFRIPGDDVLRELLRHTGPLLAPSANPQGKPPANDIAEAQAYFNDTVDFYVDSGRVENVRPSRLLQITEPGVLNWLR